MDEGTRQEIRSELYRRLLLSSAGWIRKADDLLYAARQLEPSVRSVWESRLAGAARGGSCPAGVLGVHLMLVAYAIENLLKAALVRRPSHDLRRQVERSARLPRQLATHDLSRLAKSLRIDITPDEHGLLRRLARAATWSGRYPVPKGVERRDVAYNWPRDIDHLATFIAGVRRQLAL
jgi:hypothetical protein